ncbi:MAG TPA: hypothetical protein V6C78_18335 [Crinalium sp.]|jgi:hypothetical protein
MDLANFFNDELPIIHRKPSAFAIHELPGLWRIHLQLGSVTLYSSFYTQHDQACLAWGIISAGIFTAAQFLPVDWLTQAVFASVLTVLGIVLMVYLTHHFAAIEHVRWILYQWAGLMLVGILLTNLGLLLSWGNVLARICPIWLGIIGVAYFLTGLGMRSRAMFLVSAIHILAIGVLPHVGIWQPITTGAVISLSALMLAELQWDSNEVCGYQAQPSAGYDYGLHQ